MIRKLHLAALCLMIVQQATAVNTEPTEFFPDITSLVMVNAATNAEITVLNDGMVINLNTLPGGELNFKANAGYLVESVHLSISGGDFSYERTENFEPYALFGDIDGDYFSRILTPGTYTIRATAYTRNDRGGSAGSPFEVTITLIDEVSPDGDITPPLIICPSDPILYSYPLQGTFADYVEFRQPEVIDESEVTLSVTKDILPGTPFNQLYYDLPNGFIGRKITWTAMDASGNTSSCEITFNGGSASYTSDIRCEDPIEVRINRAGSGEIDFEWPDTFGVGAFIDLVAFYSLNTEMGSVNNNFVVDNGGYIFTGECEQPVEVIIDETASEVYQYVLVDADRDIDLMLLTEGAIIDLNDFPTNNLSIRANTLSDIESVGLYLEGPITYSRRENEWPYLLFGNDINEITEPSGFVRSSVDAFGQEFTPGEYTLRTRAFFSDDLSGMEGIPGEINFSIIRPEPCDEKIQALIENIAAQSCGPESEVSLVFENLTGGSSSTWDNFVLYGVSPASQQEFEDLFFSFVITDGSCAFAVHLKRDDLSNPIITEVPVFSTLTVIDLPVFLIGEDNLLAYQQEVGRSGADIYNPDNLENYQHYNFTLNSSNSGLCSRSFTQEVIVFKPELLQDRLDRLTDEVFSAKASLVSHSGIYSNDLSLLINPITGNQVKLKSRTTKPINYYFEIYSIDGRLAHKGEISNTEGERHIDIDLPHNEIDQGIYFLKLFDPERGETETFKIYKK